MARQRQRLSRDAIVDAALELAAEHGWEPLRLHQVADACGVGLDAIHAHFGEKDELIDAWLDRADTAALRLADSGELAGLRARERLERLIMAWLATLAPYRRVTRGMIAHKLEPGHLHVQLGALLRTSRTVQWIREGARLDAPLPRRALEETALTALFLRTFACWLWDDSPDAGATHARLARELRWLEAIAARVPGGRFSGDGGTASGSGEADAPASS